MTGRLRPYLYSAMQQLSLFDDSPVQSLRRLPNCPELKVSVIRQCFVSEATSVVKQAPAMASLARSVLESAPWFDPCKECVVVFPVNCRLRVLGHNLVSIGTLTASLINPSEIFRVVINTRTANGFFLVHNHPSGMCDPSSADVRISRQIRDASRVMDIAFHDHIILGQPEEDTAGQGFYSFRQAGLL